MCSEAELVSEVCDRVLERVQFATQKVKFASPYSHNSTVCGCVFSLDAAGSGTDPWLFVRRMI
jgi:hypothetical protein